MKVTHLRLFSIILCIAAFGFISIYAYTHTLNTTGSGPTDEYTFPQGPDYSAWWMVYGSCTSLDGVTYCWTNGYDPPQINCELWIDDESTQMTEFYWFWGTVPPYITLWQRSNVSWHTAYATYVTE